MTFWSNEKIINFINFIRFRPVIWDINSHIYKNRNARKTAWREITHKFNISQEDAQKKFKNLRTYFQNEKRKLKTKQRNGNADCAESMWFAFKQMDAFLNIDLAAEGWADRDNDSERNQNQQFSISEVASNSNVFEPEAANNNNIAMETIPNPRSRPKISKSTRLRRVQTQKDMNFQNATTHTRATPRNDQRINSQQEYSSNNCKSETGNYDIVSDSSSPTPPSPKARKIKKRKIQSQKLKRLQNVHCAANESHKRSHSAFGDHLVQKLESYSRLVRNQVEFKISQILFEADMGHLDEPTRSEYSSRLQTCVSALPVHALIPEIGEDIDEKPPIFADDTSF